MSGFLFKSLEELSDGLADKAFSATELLEQALTVASNCLRRAGAEAAHVPHRGDAKAEVPVAGRH